MTIVVVTHELTSAFKIADRMAMLYDGAFVAIGTKAEIKSSKNPHVMTGDNRNSRLATFRIPDPTTK
jgi:ABC-type transporter Mla maintaining outer membrane lipid asymmetry ATPase subunit MlaF